jgi:hypothetical protein
MRCAALQPAKDNGWKRCPKPAQGTHGLCSRHELHWVGIVAGLEINAPERRAADIAHLVHQQRERRAVQP